MDRMRMRAAQVGDAEAVANLVNRAFRPDRDAKVLKKN
jgi:predicted N-acetyltransferase YhbS